MFQRILTIWFLTFGFLVGTATHLFSQDKILKPCYEGKELDRVREWEKLWVGKKIDSTTVDQVKDLLPDSLYNVMKDAAKWGEHWFEIVPYRPYQIPPGRVKYTKQGNCTIGPNDELLHWVAGVPFPEPKRGVEVAWNYDCRNHSDGFFNYALGYTIDGNMKYDRKLVFQVKSVNFAGRCEVPPTPEFPENPKGILRASFHETFEPVEAKGQTILSFIYKDRNKEDDSWIWVPGFRRIRQVSTAQRTAVDGPGDFCRDDDYGRGVKIPDNTYKLLGRKELLLARHQDIGTLKHTEGDCIFSGIQRERINTYVVEVVSKDPNYIYKTTIWYVDPEQWMITYVDKYDKSGRLWKIIEYYSDVRPAYQGIKDADFIAASCLDVKKSHATLSTIPDLKLGVEFPVNVFTISNLERSGR